MEQRKIGMLNGKAGYFAGIFLSLALLEFGFFEALYWYWSNSPWSPLGRDGCGMEYLVILFLTYPAFCLGLLIRLGLLLCWKFPHWVWYLPLILCGIGSCAFEESPAMGFFCIAAMLALPVIDFYGFGKAVRKRQ